VPTTTTVLVCRECKHHRSVERALASAEITFRSVGCQKVCQQPVCGFREADGMAWFGGMDEPKRQKALVGYLARGRRGKLPAVLKKARSKKRAKSIR
jgi:hypothetical protein